MVRPTSEFLLGAFGCFGRVLQSYDFAFRQAAGNDDVIVIPLAYGDELSVELLALLDVNGGLAVLREARPHGDEQHVGLALDDDLGRGAQARAQAGIVMLERGAGRK